MVSVDFPIGHLTVKKAREMPFNIRSYYWTRQLECWRVSHSDNIGIWALLRRNVLVDISREGYHVRLKLCQLAFNVQVLPKNSLYFLSVVSMLSPLIPEHGVLMDEGSEGDK
jgi:hypothetical protein